MPSGIQQRILSQGTWCDQPNNIAAHNGFIAALFRLCGAFHLFAHCNTKPLADQRQKIPLGGMMRHTAHRNINAVMLAAFCKRNIQRSRRSHSIIEKHLIEIAHPVKQQGVGISGF